MGSFDRPHIPPYRTTTDGRIAMQTKTRTPSVDIGDFQFYLYEPKKLKTSFLSSGTGEAAGNASMNLLASRDAFKVPTKSFVGPLAKGSVIHSAICNDPKEDAVKTCGPGGKNDCHQFSVIAPLITKSASNQDQIEFWGTKVTVEVESPKTAASKILDIRTSAPVKGATWTQGGARVLLENTITRDGRLLVARVGGLALEYPGADGRLISGRYNIVYSAIDPSLPACDPAGFKTPYPITHMPYDPLIKANYGAGRFLWTYPDGTVVPDGADTRTTYPWVSSNGENVFFASSDGQKTLQGNNPNRDPYQTKCLDGIACDLNMDDGGDTRAVVVVGAWTQGRMVLLDGMINNTDYGLGVAPSTQRVVKLFDGNDSKSWVRVGSGSANNSDGGGETVRGASGNINFIDSIENKLNHDKNMKLNVPKDVAWLVSNGTATDVVAFDDWVDPHYLISSEMVQAKTAVEATTGSGGLLLAENFKRVQNAASGLYKTPAYGEIIGKGEVERVAVGGAQGKGLFLRPSSGLAYTISSDQRRVLSNGVWFVGVAIDPRMKNDLNYRRLLGFPDGSAIDLQGLHSVSFVTATGKRFGFALNAALPFASYSHLGFRIQPNGSRVEVFRDGMLVQDWVNPSPTTDPLLRIQPGTFSVGSASGAANPSAGFHGWIDNVKVVGEAQSMTDEQMCNHSLGSVVALDRTLDANSPLLKKAQSVPSVFHDRIRRASGSAESQFLCFDANKNQDGWVDLNVLPAGVVSLRHALLFPEGNFVFDQPRPDSSNNAFCVSCHTDDGSGRRPPSLMLNALTFNSQITKALDPRRQPSEPPARVFGNLPAGTWTPFPLADEVAPIGGKLIDEYIVR